ncbi:MAG: hypothetical protein XU14_C0062G0006 [Armatimonadetes bacterium CSP1-3]|nr:MAG: hypothetical protein XU14_C0062G0006 [Armatimonadetes bacterium CSP1-3]
MGTQDARQKDLAELFAIYLNRGDRVRLVEYLVTHSNLPGPRGNLELAQAFAEEAAVRTGPDQDKVWTLCLNLAGISPAHAPTNSPMEFLPFCGAVGLGAVAAASPQRVDRALTELRRLADDSRWRMREAVAMALQELLRHHPQKTLARLKTWIADEHWLAMRAVAAGIAEPALLEDNPRMAAAALQAHRQILQRVRAAADRRTESFRTLRQALGYSISVVVTATPKAAFALLRGLAAARDPDVQWIVRENLKKQRLVRADPRQAAALARRATPSAAATRRHTPSRGGRASRKG